METDDLIGRLVSDAHPVRRLAAPWKRAILWLAIAAPYVAGIIFVHGLSSPLAAMIGDQRLMLEEAASLATALVAAIGAFAMVVPGQDRRFLWLLYATIGLWLACLGEGCLTDWDRFGAAGLALRADWECFWPMVWAGILPSLAMVVMLRQGMPLAPRSSSALAGLAVAAVANLGMRLFHVGDVTIMVLVWHFGMVIVISALASCAGPYLPKGPPLVATA